METQLVIFLAFVSAALLINAGLLFGIYKSFSTVATKLTTSLREFQSNAEARAGIESLVSVSETARETTELARRKFSELEPALAQAQERYTNFLRKADRNTEDAAEAIADNAERARNAVVNPAHKIGAMVAGAITVLGPIKDWQEQDES
jgi:vacuolar-type H+-ATPase subunit H